jgi:zinc-ribbon family
MIYLYGKSKALDIRTLNIHEITCKNCDQKGTLLLQSYVRYNHLFFVPVVTDGKKSVVACANCEKEYDVSKQSEKIQSLAKSEQDRLKIPIWHFTGCCILVLPLIIRIAYDLLVNY